MITVDRTKLATALSSLTKLGGDVRIRAFKGHLIMAATDRKTWLHLTMEASGDLDPICVKGSRLNDAVSSFSLDLIGLKVEGRSIFIHGGKGKRTLPITDAAEFPDPEFNGKLIATLEADALRKALDFTLPHVPSTDDLSKSHVAGVFLFTEGGKLKAIGTDGSQIAMIDVVDSGESVEVAIPGPLAELAHRAVSGKVELSLSKRALELRWNGGAIRGQLLEKPVPMEILASRTKYALSHSKEGEEPFSVSVEGSAFRSALRAVQGFGEVDHGSRGRRVKLTLNGTATLSTASAEHSAEEPVPMDLSEARDIEIGFSSSRMERVLRGFGDRVLTVSVLGMEPKAGLPDRVMKFEAAGLPDRVALLFPMAI